jgi:LPS-assembly protein
MCKSNISQACLARVVCFAFCCLLFSFQVSAQQQNELDWVPIELLTPEQLKLVPAACCGAYLPPLREDAESDIDPDKANIFGTADYSESEKQTKFIMRDDVYLTQGRRSFRADLFSFDQVTREAKLQGNIQMRESDLLLRADKAYVDTNTGSARLDNARFVLYSTRVRGRAESLKKVGDDLISLDTGYFTSCEPEDNTWSIKGSNITIHNDEHYGTARNMRLHIKDIPIAYVPYFRFPVGPDRLTGFLFPSVSIDRDDGLEEFILPFYWNIAPNYDATLTPRYLSDHGYLLATELRHMSTYFDTQLTSSILNNDRGGFSERLRDQIESGELTEAEAYPHRGKDRWQYGLKQKGGRNQRWTTKIDYTDVSDTDYIRDVDASAVDLNRQAYIRQSFSTDYAADNWNLGAKLEEFRLLTSNQLPYRELPRLHADGDYRWNDWLIELDHEYTHFSANRFFEGDRDNLITGERLRTRHQLTWDGNYTSGFFKPAVGVKTLSYQLEANNLLPTADESPFFNAPQASVDTGLYFEREKSFFGDNYVQTLEPRAFYLYRDYENQNALFDLTASGNFVNFDTSDLAFTYQQLFRDTRFSGGDRIDDANSLTFGLTSRFIDLDSGVEGLSLSLGKILYFEDPKINILNRAAAAADAPSTSAVAGQVGMQIGEYFHLTNDIVYDDRKDRVNTLSSSLHYLDDKYRVFNVGYRYSRDPASLSPLNPLSPVSKTLNQIDVASIWPLSEQWSIIARVNYDFNYNAELDTFAGIEYTDCCYRIRILAREWVDFDLSPDFLANLDQNDYKRGVFFEVQLRGFGSIGQRISNLLGQAILGYDERETSLR